MSLANQLLASSAWKSVINTSDIKGPWLCLQSDSDVIIHQTIPE